LIDYGFTPDGNAFLVTELFEGVNLPVAVPESLGDRCAILADVGRALSAMARRKTFHNNLSPANILVLDEGEQAVAAVAGLGTAPFLTSGERMELATHLTDLSRYASPELKRGEAEVGTEAAQDVYSYGITICDLLGLKVEGLGKDSLKVVIPRVILEEWREARNLREPLVNALQRDPDVRRVSVDRLVKLMNAGSKGLAKLAGAKPSFTEEPSTPAVSTSAERAGPATAPPSPPRQHETNPADLEGVARGAVKRAEVPSRPKPPPIPTTPRPTATPASQQAPTAAEPLQATPPSTPAPLREAEREPEVTPEVQPEPKQKPLAISKQPGNRHWLIPAIAASAVFVAVLATVVVVFINWYKGRQVEPVATTPVVTPTPTPLPTPSAEVPTMHQQLQAAELAVQEENTAAAREALDQLTALEVASFSDGERLLHQELLEAVEGIDFRQAVDELRESRKSGDITKMRRAVNALAEAPAEELDSEAGLRREVENARTILSAHTLLWRAKRAGDNLQVIERADRMISLLPAYRNAANMKEDAAREIGTQADRDVDAGNFLSAAKRLEQLKRVWPQRPGVQQRIDWCNARQRELTQGEQVLAQVRQLNQAGKPDEALKLLEGASLGDRFATQVQQTKASLQRRMQELDAGTPTVTLAQQMELVFRKNDTLKIPFDVVDDFSVVNLRLMVRSKDEASFHDAPLQQLSETRWVLELTPERHKNQTVYFYLIATDRSGHTGSLGNASQPIEVKRKKWFQP
jgi:serine/threonine protein kinase